MPTGAIIKDHFDSSNLKLEFEPTSHSLKVPNSLLILTRKKNQKVEAKKVGIKE
jgi:hypothetical protein